MSETTVKADRKSKDEGLCMGGEWPEPASLCWIVNAGPEDWDPGVGFKVFLEAIHSAGDQP